MPGEPGFQDGLDRGDERRPPFLAAFAPQQNTSIEKKKIIHFAFLKRNEGMKRSDRIENEK